MRYKLDEAARALLKGLAGGGDDFEVYGGGGAGRDGVDFPGRRLANAYFGFADACRLFSSRDSMPNEA